MKYIVITYVDRIQSVYRAWALLFWINLKRDKRIVYIHIYLFNNLSLKQDLLVAVVCCAGRDAATKLKLQSTCSKITPRTRRRTRVRYVEKHARTNAAYWSTPGCTMSTRLLVVQSVRNVFTVKLDCEGNYNKYEIFVSFSGHMHLRRIIFHNSTSKDVYVISYLM